MSPALHWLQKLLYHYNYHSYHYQTTTITTTGSNKILLLPKNRKNCFKYSDTTTLVQIAVNFTSANTTAVTNMTANKVWPR